MPVPPFHHFMKPYLQLLGDKQIHEVKTIKEKLIAGFSLSPADLAERLSSGQPVYQNRLNWAKSYLKNSGLLENVTRTTVRITEQGLHVLKDNPERLDSTYLMRFPQFVAFATGTRPDDTEAITINEQTEITPEEQLEASFNELHKNLAHELLSKIMNNSPAFFENLVVELIVKMGYGGSIQEAGKAIGKSGDEGIDGIIKEDILGLDAIYIQAKRWQTDKTIGRPEIQKFVGALAGKGASKGIFITTSNFTRDAREYVPMNNIKIVLIDGTQLAQYMIDHNLGVSTTRTYIVKKMDGDYFEEE